MKYEIAHHKIISDKLSRLWLSSTGRDRGRPRGSLPPPPETFAAPPEIWSENNRKISITKEICITIDFASPPNKIPGRKPGLNIKNLIKLDLEIFIYKTHSNSVPNEMNYFFVSTREAHSYHTRFSVNGNFYFQSQISELGEEDIPLWSKLQNETLRNIRDAQSSDRFEEKLP